MLIEMARRCRDEGKTVKKPLKRPFSLQGDGDLWECFWKAVMARNPYTIKITKVKGHATDEMVADGRVQPQDRRGNDKADSAADS